MIDIKLLNKISPSGLDLLDKKKYSCSEDIENPDAIMLRSFSMHDYELGSELKAIARAGAGVNNIPLDRCSENGVVVFNTPGANANAVKELVISGILMSSRKIIAGIKWVDGIKDEGDNVSALVEKTKGKFVGPEVYGKSLGVIGLGAIGVLVCIAASSLGMKVYGYDPYMSVDHAWGLSRKAIHANSLSEIYENCDYISLHVPYTPQTKGMISAESIAGMKNGVRILNFARGELVENADMLSALQDGKVGVYVTDFPKSELIGERGVINIPHLGASTPESEDNCAKMATTQLMEYLESGNITNSVNMPNVTMQPSGKERICIIHRNESGMISKITGVFSEQNINIANLVNKSRDGYAYTIIDLDEIINSDITEILSGVDGVIKSRIIKL